MTPAWSGEASSSTAQGRVAATSCRSAGGTCRGAGWCPHPRFRGAPVVAVLEGEPQHFGDRFRQRPQVAGLRGVQGQRHQERRCRSSHCSDLFTGDHRHPLLEHAVHRPLRVQQPGRGREVKVGSSRRSSPHGTPAGSGLLVSRGMLLPQWPGREHGWRTAAGCPVRRVDRGAALAARAAVHQHLAVRQAGERRPQAPAETPPRGVLQALGAARRAREAGPFPGADRAYAVAVFQVQRDRLKATPSRSRSSMVCSSAGSAGRPRRSPALSSCRCRSRSAWGSGCGGREQARFHQDG